MSYFFREAVAVCDCFFNLKITGSPVIFLGICSDCQNIIGKL